MAGPAQRRPSGPHASDQFSVPEVVLKTGNLVNATGPARCDRTVSLTGRMPPCITAATRTSGRLTPERRHRHGPDRDPGGPEKGELCGSKTSACGLSPRTSHLSRGPGRASLRLTWHHPRSRSWRLSSRPWADEFVAEFPDLGEIFDSWFETASFSVCERRGAAYFLDLWDADHFDGLSDIANNLDDCWCGCRATGSRPGAPRRRRPGP